MIKLNLCPQFSLIKFLVLVSFFEVFYFLLTVFCASSLGPQFLQPDAGTLVAFGAKYAYNMKYKFQIWRFITPIFLHGGFMHLFSNLISQLIFGLSMEVSLGTKNMIFLYFLSGFGGYLFSSLASDSISVGASGSILGILGCYLGYFIKNWDELSPLGTLRYSFLCLLLMVVILNFAAGTGQRNSIDGWGHFGGFVTGLLLGLVIVKPIFNGDKQKKMRLYGMVILSSMLLICFICFYTATNPTLYSF